MSPIIRRRAGAAALGRTATPKTPSGSKAMKQSGPQSGALETQLHAQSVPAAVTFPIVGIGASAGGLEAFTQLLQNLPIDTGMAFVLVQHLDPVHASALTQILSKATSLPVQEVTND